MFGISCCCSLPSSACATCSSLHPELSESHNYEESHTDNSEEQTHILVSLPMGWICPICNCGISPNVQQCSCQLKVQS